MTTYRYSISGTAALGQTWKATGLVEALPGELSEAFTEACRQAFLTVTGGRAVYGHPGLGCQGPYRITGILMETEE